MPEIKDIVIQTCFEVRKGDEFIRDIAFKGILGSIICCRRTSDAKISRNTEKKQSPFPPGLTASTDEEEEEEKCGKIALSEDNMDGNAKELNNAVLSAIPRGPFPE